MILYNITFNIEPEIKEAWLRWMQENYIPFVMESGYFLDVKKYQLLNETENQGLTYSIQLFSDSLEKVNAYLENAAPQIVDEHNQVFKYKHVSFMTILESID